MSIYRLTTRAEDDLIDIFAFGIEQFGLRQALLDKSELAHCFQLLSQNPNMGRKAL